MIDKEGVAPSVPDGMGTWKIVSGMFKRAMSLCCFIPPGGVMDKSLADEVVKKVRDLKDEVVSLKLENAELVKKAESRLVESTMQLKNDVFHLKEERDNLAREIQRMKDDDAKSVEVLSDILTDPKL